MVVVTFKGKTVHQNHQPVYLQFRETIGGNTIYGIIKNKVTVGYIVSSDAGMNEKEWVIDPKVNYPKRIELVRYMIAGMSRAE